MTKKLTWRLSKLPSVEELRELVKDKIITQEEARDILFNSSDGEERDTESLKAEIKFLRELVDSLSKKGTVNVVETIKYIEKPYYGLDWYKPYIYVTCNTASQAGIITGTTSANCIKLSAINNF